MIAYSSGWLFHRCLLIAFACGLLILQTTSFGQSEDPVIDAWLSKLRSIEKFESSTTQANTTAPSVAGATTESSLTETPTPARLAEILELVLKPSPSGSNRFFIADSSPRGKLRRDPGAWALDAIALYMESWSEEYIGGLQIIQIGGWDSPRVQAGRFRRLQDQYWIPWDEFSIADGKQLRSDPDVAAWYSQACGLAHFLLDSDPVVKEKFLTYLQSVYRRDGSNAAKALTDDQTLRTAYDQYLLTETNPPGDPTASYSLRPGFLRRNESIRI